MTYSHKAMKQCSKLRLDLSRQNFEQVLWKAAPTSSFATGCAEIGRQVNAPVTASLNGKFDSVVTPAADVVNEVIGNLSSCLTSLRDKVRTVLGKDEDELDNEDVEGDGEAVDDNGYDVKLIVIVK